MSIDLEEIFNNRAKDLNDHDPWRYGEELSRKTDEIEIRWVISHLDRAESLLDIGCGTGRHAIELAKVCGEVMAVDFADENIRILRQKARGVTNLSSFRCRAQDISILDRKFGTLLGIGLIQYLTDEEMAKFFADAHKLISDGGYLMLKVPTTTEESFIFQGYSDLLKSDYYSKYRNAADIREASLLYFDLIKMERTFTSENLGNDLDTIERHETTKQNWFLFKKK